MPASDVRQDPNRTHLRVGFLGDHPNSVVQSSNQSFRSLQLSRRNVWRNELGNTRGDWQTRKLYALKPVRLFLFEAFMVVIAQASAVVKGILGFVYLVGSIDNRGCRSDRLGGLCGGDFGGFGSSGIFVAGKGLLGTNGKPSLLNSLKGLGRSFTNKIVPSHRCCRLGNSFQLRPKDGACR